MVSDLLLNNSSSSYFKGSFAVNQQAPVFPVSESSVGRLHNLELRQYTMLYIYTLSSVLVFCGVFYLNSIVQLDGCIDI